MAAKTLLVFLITLCPISSLYADDFDGIILKNEQTPLISLQLKPDGSFITSAYGSHSLEVFTRDGAIKGGFNTAQFKDAIISPERRKLLTDFDTVEGEEIYVLLVAAQSEDSPPEAVILGFSDTHRLSDLNSIQLSKKIAASKLRIDAAGNFYLLGLAEPDYQKTIIEKSAKDCPILHKFTPEGDHVYSTLMRHIDPSPQNYSLSYSSPIVTPSIFGVSPSGEAWVLWYVLREGNVNWPETVLFNISPDGNPREVKPSPPEDGFILTGLIKNSDTSEVLFEWKGVYQKDGIETILTDSGGAIFLRGYYTGRILSLNGDCLVAIAMKNGEHAVIKYTY